MRILMVSYGYPPVIGGAEQHVRNLSVELAARGHDVAVATLSHDGLPDFEDDRGVRIYRLRGTVHRVAARLFKVPGRVYAPPFPDPELALALRRIVRHERPQIVHAHNWLLHSFLPLKRWSGAKVVETLHSYGLVCAKWTLLDQAAAICTQRSLSTCLACAREQYGSKTLPTVMGRWATTGSEVRGVDRFLPVSPAVAAGNELAATRRPYTVVPNFIPDDLALRKDDAAPCLRALPPGDFILFVGALTAKKGIHVLLDAYRGLAAPPPLVLIGSPWRDTPDSFPPNVIALQNWPHAAVMAAWDRCLFGIVPSIWPEPSPTVVLEAMAMGRPVIAARTGGMTEQVVDGQTGILVPPGDAAALRAAMERLLADSALCRSLGAAGRAKVAEFQASQVVTRVEHIYEEVLAS